MMARIERTASRALPGICCLLFLLLVTAIGATNTGFDPAEPELISQKIVDLIEPGEPIYLDIQAGDLTSRLDFRIRQLLIAKGADLRESELDIPEEEQADTLGVQPVSSLASMPTRLVRIRMELDWTTQEKRSFFSFRSERLPLYVFNIKQISLPKWKLAKIDNLSFVDQPAKFEASRPLTLKWFEPLLAATALASVIYILWTTK